MESKVKSRYFVFQTWDQCFRGSASVPVFKNSMYLQLFPSGKIYLQTVNVTIFVSFTFDLFDVMCRQQHETELNPFLN